MPTTLHEVVKKGIIFEEEMQGSKRGDKNLNPIVPSFMGNLLEGGGAGGIKE